MDNTGPITPELTPHMEPRRRPRVLGWVLCIVASLILFFVPAAQTGFDPTAVGLALIAILLGMSALLALLVGVGLLMWGYVDFFRLPWGFPLWIGVLTVSLFTSSLLLPDSTSAMSAGISTLASSWGIAASLAIGPALTLYLIHTDRSVRVFAICYLLLMWVLFAFGQRIGWDVFMLRIVGGAPGGGLWFLQALLCTGIWVTMICPAAFIWHTIVLARRELHGRVNDQTSSPSIG